ncbi:tetratricopeptide repeat protein [Bordetella sp. 15P40C-2]|uniref:type III secretion apparatus assembly chaperone SctY n=1 Tax=Bordetella sp. 15P40C-2 TaxID=2572246 RepID=UPI001329475B|nr:tetratricopeptide repeat protein [Bordetella sp. 15P40C-2]MVW70492.1 tetratricopeptide repeat protein [Bordetella sp. 15P40C-2]
MPFTNDAHELLGLLAYIHLEHHQPEKSVVLLQALHAIGVSTPKEETMLALSLLQAGKPEAALARLDQLALNGVSDAACHLIRSQALHALGRKVEARAAMRAYLRARAASVTRRPDPASLNFSAPSSLA